MSTEEKLAEKPEVITIQEEQDGSATVELPESISSPDAQSDHDGEGSDEVKSKQPNGGLDENRECAGQGQNSKPSLLCQSACLEEDEGHCKVDQNRRQGEIGRAHV